LKQPDCFFNIQRLLPVVGFQFPNQIGNIPPKGLKLQHGALAFIQAAF
jgi:hypothetical protein